MTEAHEPATAFSPVTESPLILFCSIHKDPEGRPLPFMVLGERTVHKKIEGVWTTYTENIYECPKCVFPEWGEMCTCPDGKHVWSNAECPIL